MTADTDKVWDPRNRGIPEFQPAAPAPEAVALLAEAIQKWQDPEGREVHDRDCGCGIEAQGMLLAYPPLAATLETGVAWQAAIDALPGGWWLSGVDQVYPARPEWTATAYSRDDHRRAEGSTPADALRALTAKLLEAKP